MNYLKTSIFNCFILLFTSTFSLLAHATISNIIVFGDSLSDGGNFPESKTALWNSKAPKTLHNVVPQFYVPYSNPVDTHGTNSADFPWPTLNDQYLSPQVMMGEHPAKRKYRSISWPQFFLSFAKSQKIIASDIISPSDLLNEKNLLSTISYNYAWGYATAGRWCRNPHYQKTDLCDAKSIFSAKQRYLKNPTMRNYLAIAVPGMRTQIDLFLQDKKAQKVRVDQHSIYVFWTGGNNLIIASHAFFKNKNPLPLLSVLAGSVGTQVLKGVGTLLHALPINQRPKAVYVFELFNPGLTPAYTDKPRTAKLGNWIVRASNFWLRWDARLFNVFSPTQIIIVPSYQWFEDNAHNHYFKNHAGEDCYTVVSGFNNPARIPSSNCDGFMFWNAVHPASPMNAIVARDFYKQYFND